MVEDAIQALNNKDRNDLYLQAEAAEAHTTLTVGGGAGRYVVSGATLAEAYPALLTKEQRFDEPFQFLVVGGQKGDYPSEHVVTLAEAIAAAKAYFETGRFEGGDWREI
jgi:hypothetical protein